MKLAILETGHPPGKLAGEFGDYPDDVRAAARRQASRSRRSTCRTDSFRSSTAMTLF